MDRLSILLFILLFTFVFINVNTEHLTSESNEALQTLSSLYTNQGTLVVPNLKVTGAITASNITASSNVTAANLTLTGNNSGSCGAKNICMSVAPEYTGNYGLYVSGNIQAENAVEAINLYANNEVYANILHANDAVYATNSSFGTIQATTIDANGPSGTINATNTNSANTSTTNFYVAGKQITSF